MITGLPFSISQSIMSDINSSMEAATMQDVAEIAEDDDAQREKVRENRVRRALHRQGYALHKSRMRDPRGIGYGRFYIADINNRIVAGGHTQNGYDLTIDEVERFAKEGP